MTGFVGGDSGGVTSADFDGSIDSGSAVTNSTCEGADTDAAITRSSAVETGGAIADPLLGFLAIDVAASSATLVFGSFTAEGNVHSRFSLGSSF